MLSRLPGVRVASRGSSFAYRSSPLDVRRIGSALGVTSVLEGSVQRQAEKVRITVGLTDALEGFQIWAETYDKTVTDMFVIQEEIARLGGPGVERSAHEGSRRRSIGPGAEAYDMYLQGRHHFYRGGTEETKRAITLFQEATRIAPNYCLALAGLADACSFLHLYYEPHPETLAAADPTAPGGRCRCLDGGAQCVAWFRPWRRRPLRGGEGVLRQGAVSARGTVRERLPLRAHAFRPGRPGWGGQDVPVRGQAQARGLPCHCPAGQGFAGAR